MTMFKRIRAMPLMGHSGACCAEPKRFAMDEHGELGFRGRGFSGDGHGHRHGRGRGGPGGHLRRLLEHGDLRMLVLYLIAERPRHGYEIIKAIEDLAGGTYIPSPGVVYPTLTMLEEIGHVTSIAEGNRKSFTLTPEGEAALAAERSSVETILARIAQMRADIQSREPSPPVMRAMENLRTALRLKLANGSTTPDLARKIADALDHAVRQIEDL